MSSKLTVWQIQDEKPGHRNQLRGLTQAFGELAPVECCEIAAPPRSSCLAWWWAKRFPPGETLPRPDLILGAGHATHFALLAAQHAFGGKTVVLMKPSLPPALFDLCLVPEHDRIAEKPNVVLTRGALNTVRPTPHHSAQKGLMLIGGPSHAHGWSEESMLSQVRTIVASSPTVHWQLTNSRRTPEGFLKELQTERFVNLQIVGHQQTSPEWLPQQLAQSSQAWVSEDSVSMVYEALTSGAAVGILQVPCPRPGRVSQGIEALCEQRWVTRYRDWSLGDVLSPPPEQLNEARRCAELILQRFNPSVAA